MEHVDFEEAQRRAEIVVDVQSDIIDAYNDSVLGSTREVLCEGFDPQAQMFYGRSYAPPGPSPPCASPAPWTASSPEKWYDPLPLLPHAGASGAGTPGDAIL